MWAKIHQGTLQHSLRNSVRVSAGQLLPWGGHYFWESLKHGKVKMCFRVPWKGKGVYFNSRMSEGNVMKSCCSPPGTSSLSLPLQFLSLVNFSVMQVVPSAMYGCWLDFSMKKTTNWQQHFERKKREKKSLQHNKGVLSWPPYACGIQLLSFLATYFKHVLWCLVISLHFVYLVMKIIKAFLSRNEEAKQIYKL